MTSIENLLMENNILTLEIVSLNEKIKYLNHMIKNNKCCTCGHMMNQTCDYCGKDIINKDDDKICEKCSTTSILYHHSTSDNCVELCDECSKGNCTIKERENCYICKSYDSDEDTKDFI